MRWIAVGALCCGLAVILGAFAAHGLKGSLSANQINVFQTGVQYQFYHGLALVFTGILIEQGFIGRASSWIAWCFLLGIVLFSGSLYALVLIGIGQLGWITPIGGLLFVLAWMALALMSWRNLSVKK